MEFRRVLWLLVGFVNLRNTRGTEKVEYVSKELTSIPLDISSSMTHLDCTRNSISNVKDSDFNDKYPNLVVLLLGRNKLTSIDCGCFKGTVLKTIDIRLNGLTVFPDFREVQDTLQNVVLNNNNIRRISHEDINYLINLSRLSLNQNPLEQLPDLTVLLPSLKNLYLDYINLDCCKSTVWMKDLTIEGKPCKNPSTWREKLLAEISEQMLHGRPCQITSSNWTHSDTTITDQTSIVTTEQATMKNQPSIVTTEQATMKNQPSIVTTEQATMKNQPSIVTTENAKKTNQRTIIKTDNTILTEQPKILTTEKEGGRNEVSSATMDPRMQSKMYQETLNLTSPNVLGTTINPFTKLLPSLSTSRPFFSTTVEPENTTTRKCEVTDSNATNVACRHEVVPGERPPLPKFVVIRKEGVAIVDSMYITSHVVIGSSFIIATFSVLLFVVLSDVPRILQHIHYLNVPYGQIFNVDQSRKRRRKALGCRRYISKRWRTGTALA
ncbi:hypothetical protein CAPTEDRAFT_184967 [Capitella teleta]|uniref:LRRCT domain-containing protein n=1 Tax=Capitella teleta TaxID=283909 RepID=R7UFT7_CAPTE|nr:hypothetical protein CAPTEDRAFT_184967 [Capitella teleta]|eukprot:ELU04963.1 hypothetical protein CAPTEDRAFT_184967 [Capitella teleta]